MEAEVNPHNISIQKQDENQDKKYMEEEEEEEDIFVVESILDHRIVNGRVEYLLKWKSFGDNEATWEDGADMNCPLLLEEYIKKCTLEAKLKTQQNIIKDENEIRLKHPTLIIAAYYVETILYYRVFCESTNSFFSAPADQLREVCPELICKFLENKIK